MPDPRILHHLRRLARQGLLWTGAEHDALATPPPEPLARRIRGGCPRCGDWLTGPLYRTCDECRAGRATDDEGAE